MYKVRLVILKILKRIANNHVASSILITFFKPIIVIYNYQSQLRTVTLGNDSKLNKFLFSQLNDRVVLNGPFKGLKFPKIPSSLMHLNFSAQILGTYESELHGWLIEITNNLSTYGQIINIGSGGGYYAVGLAVKGIDVNVKAIDTCELANTFLTKTAQLNGVDNLVKCYLDLRGLGEDNYNKGRNLWIIDCEGCENEILLKSSVDFSKCDILIETHEFVHYNIVTDVQTRFCESHTIDVVNSIDDMAKITTYDCPQLREVSKAIKYKLISENRNIEMKWMYLKSKKHNAK